MLPVLPVLLILQLPFVYCLREIKKQKNQVLELPTSATRNDSTVMITGKIQELGYGPASVQFVTTNSEVGELLSLQDRVFLHVPYYVHNVASYFYQNLLYRT